MTMSHADLMLSGCCVTADTSLRKTFKNAPSVRPAGQGVCADRSKLTLDMSWALRRSREAPIDLDELVAQLTSLGMEEDHARLYIHLVRAGPSKASTLASLSGFSRSKVYRTLDGMSSEGYAEVQLGQPRIFRAVEPQTLMDRFEDRWARGAERVRSARDQLIEPLGSLAEEPVSSPDGPSWRIVQGRLSLLDELIDQVEDAEEEVLVAACAEEMSGQAPPLARFWEVLNRRDDEGPAVRVIVLGGSDPVDLPVSPAFPLRRVDETGAGCFAVVDRRTLLARAFADAAGSVNAEDDVAILTDAHGSVSQYLVLFEMLWDAAAPDNEVTACAEG